MNDSAHGNKVVRIAQNSQVNVGRFARQTIGRFILEKQQAKKTLIQSLHCKNTLAPMSTMHETSHKHSRPTRIQCKLFQKRRERILLYIYTVSWYLQSDLSVQTCPCIQLLCIGYYGFTPARLKSKIFLRGALSRFLNSGNQINRSIILKVSLA